MKSSKNVDLMLDHFEGCKLAPYRDSAGIPTIGIGCTFYPGGKRVTMQDKPLRSKEEAYALLATVLAGFEDEVSIFTKNIKLTQNQFDALVVFHYNTGALRSSTLLKKIKANPLDKTIWGAFLLYDKARADKDGIDNDGDGLIDEPGEMEELLGLIRRRNSEAHLYFLGSLNYYEQLKKK